MGNVSSATASCHHEEMTQLVKTLLGHHCNAQAQAHQG